MDVCGNVVWRLPFRTHHTVYLDKNNMLWVPGQIKHEKKIDGFPNFKPPFIEPLILKVSLDGKIVKQISVLELLKKNNLRMSE